MPKRSVITVRSNKNIQSINVYLGRNDTENNQLIDENFELFPNFIWLHLNKLPSGHAIIKCNLESLNESILTHAAEFCFKNTKYSKIPVKLLNKIEVVYTPMYNVKKTKNAGVVEFYDESKLNYFSVKR